MSLDALGLDEIGRVALPENGNADGRPVWEPPMLNYAHLIDEEYEKKRDAVLEYFSSDVSETTSFMDLSVETELQQLYEEWTIANANAAMRTGDTEREAFYDGLLSGINKDDHDVDIELREFGLKLERQENGKFRVSRAGS